jgi:NAD-dependent deacetylase
LVRGCRSISLDNIIFNAISRFNRRFRHLAEAGGEMLLVTQNIDGLHRAAGSRQLVEVHGRADRLRCSGPRCELGGDAGSLPRAADAFDAFRPDPRRANLPVCSLCGALLRPHILWFDEMYTGHRDYQIERVLRTAKHANLVLFAGTSFSVGVTEFVLRTALGRGVRLINIDPSGRSPHPKVSVLAAPAEQVLPAVVAELRGSAPARS